MQYYDDNVDIWAIGCIMAEFWLRKPFFRGNNYIEQLKLIFDFPTKGINKFPLNSLPLIAKKMSPFFTFLLSRDMPLILIFLIFRGKFLISFFNNIIFIKLVVIYG